MREDGGYALIKDAIYKLGARHAEHIAYYGEGNDRRLTGKHETASIHNFRHGKKKKKKGAHLFCEASVVAHYAVGLLKVSSVGAGCSTSSPT